MRSAADGRGQTARVLDRVWAGGKGQDELPALDGRSLVQRVVVVLQQAPDDLGESTIFESRSQGGRRRRAAAGARSRRDLPRKTSPSASSHPSGAYSAQHPLGPLADAGAHPHRLSRPDGIADRLGEQDAADLVPLALEHQVVPLQAAQRVPQQRVEVLLRALSRLVESAQERPAVQGHASRSTTAGRGRGRVGASRARARSARSCRPPCTRTG